MNGKRAVAATINLGIFIWTAICVISFINFGGEGNMSSDRLSCFCYFTVDSNILSAIASLAVAIALISGRRFHKIATFKFIGTVSVMVTFLTVMVFLGPAYGYAEMFEGNNLYLHLIGPLMALVTCCFLDDGERLSFGESLLGLIPVTAYGLIYMHQVIVFRSWPDFYGFASGSA